MPDGPTLDKDARLATYAKIQRLIKEEAPVSSCITNTTCWA